MLDPNMGMAPSNEDLNRPMYSDADEAIDQLNSFLRGEISAAETYRMAIEKAGDPTNNAPTLEFPAGSRKSTVAPRKRFAIASANSVAKRAIRPAPGARGPSSRRAPRIYLATPRASKR